jgi:hypothetical protein
MEVPAPHAVVVWLELSIAQRLLQTGRLDCAASDLKIDPYIDVGCSRVSVRGPRAQQGWDEPAEQYELRATPVVMHDPHECQLGGCPGCD